MLLKFELYQDDGLWCGRAVGHDIFTQGESLDELMSNIQEAATVHFD